MVGSTEISSAKARRELWEGGNAEGGGRSWEPALLFRGSPAVLSSLGAWWMVPAPQHMGPG